MVLIQERPAFQRPPLRFAATTVSENSNATSENKNRPKWVDQGERRIGKGEHVLTVSAGPHASEQLGRKDLMEALRQAVDAYIDSFIEEPGASRRVQLGMDYILQRLVEEQYSEPVPNSFGVEMKQYYALVRIDPAAHDLIRQRYEAAKVQARLGYAGAGFGLVLALL